MDWTLAVENIKCGGCAKSIARGLSAIEGVASVEVDVAAGAVRIKTVDAGGRGPAREQVARRLLEMGYPERDTASGLGAAVATAKSFVSCAVGSLSGKG